MDDILERIRTAYGSFEEPAWSFVWRALQERPYERLLQELTASFQVEEYTDPNDDVSFGYVLSRGEERWVLELSMVGPFAMVSRTGNGPEAVLTPDRPDLVDAEQQLMRVLLAHGIRPLRRSELEQPVPLRLHNVEPEATRVYQALFSDVAVLPWR